MKSYKIKKVNIHFQRKLFLYYSRIILILKYFGIIFIYFFFFTTHLSFIKNTTKDFFFEISNRGGLKFEKLVIEGLKNVPETKILQAIDTKVNEPLFKINLKLVKKILEHDPWIKAAIVKRQLPNTLHVILFENIPVARWQINNKIFLIDEEGNSLGEGNEDRFSNLPHIVGKGANIYSKKLINDLNKAPELASKLVSAVRYGQRRWDLNFVQNITVKMPENEFNKAWNYIIALNNNNKLFNQNYKVLDLRDKDKYYIEKHL